MMRISIEDEKRDGREEFKNFDMADSIYVINVGGYIGKSTRTEIEYAKVHGKEVYYLEE